MRSILIIITFLFPTLLLAQYTVETVPNQKLVTGTYVSNPDNILTQITVQQIDTLLRSLEKRTTVQVAVVVLESIGSADPFDFAQQLFVTWGIGNKENNNGLLVLFVNDKHIIRFHTGDGLEAALPDIVCKRIQRDHMVPAFKNGDYQTGMTAGLTEVTRVLTDPKYAEELKKPEDESSPWVGFVTFLVMFVLPVLGIVYWVKAANGKFKDSKPPSETPYPEMRLTRWQWLIEFVGIPLLIVIVLSVSPVSDPTWGFLAVYGYYMLTAFRKLYRMKAVIKRFLVAQDFHEIVEFLRAQQWYWFLAAFLFPFPLIGYFWYHLFRKRLYRNHPRNCKECDGKMKKLNDKDEDQFLTPGQLAEENLRSVNYDVWQCVSCASVEFWFFLNKFSKYDPCPKCKTIAFYCMSDRTITSASYTSSGTGEKTLACKFCGHQKKSTYSIAQLVRSTSSGSSGGSSYSGGSSGGSWGGGSSSGGGASSSW
jgi:uncharacterized protein